MLIVGEQGGASAKTVFTGFGIAFVYQFLVQGLQLWKEIVTQPLALVPRGRASPWKSTRRCWASATSSARGSPASWSAGGVLAYLRADPGDPLLRRRAADAALSRHDARSAT